MGRNIVVCLDGTGNEVRATGVTNVLKLVELLDLRDPATQVVYYDPGVGTFAAPGAWTAAARAVSRLGGLALGHGLRQNLAEAYTFLMNTWQSPDDRLFLFGFSRGAYTARALCGMLHRLGLLRPGSENLVPYAVRAYARSAGAGDLREPEGWDRMDRFAEALAVRPTADSLSVPVEFLGVFDTVKATRVLSRDIAWPYTRQLPNVATVRHAVSIDEKRRPYREYLVPGQPPRVTEAWFAGVHSDVGGGFADDPELGRVSLRWMVEGAATAGLLVREQRLRHRCTLTESDAYGTAHRMGGLWPLLGSRRRPVPPGARVHASVRSRIAKDPDYAGRVPADVVWDEEAWPFGAG